jgi:hypothetical protein
MPKRKTTTKKDNGQSPKRFRVTVKGAPESPESHEAGIRVFELLLQNARRRREEQAAASKNPTGEDS